MSEPPDLRALDLAIYCEVFGREVYEAPDGWWWKPDQSDLASVPFFSSDWNAAARVLEKVTGYGCDRYPRGLGVSIIGGVLDEGYTVEFLCRKTDARAGEGEAHTLPLAIARAALACVRQREAVGEK